MKNRGILILTLIAVLAFISSLFFPAFLCEHRRRSYLGSEVLMIGWLGLLTLDPRWMLNIIFILTALSNLKSKASGFYANKSSLLAQLLFIGSLSCLVIPGMGCPTFDSPGMSVGLSTGGYLWVFAMLVIAIGAYLRNKEQAGQDTENVKLP